MYRSLVVPVEAVRQTQLGCIWEFLLHSGFYLGIRDMARLLRMIVQSRGSKLGS